MLDKELKKIIENPNNVDSIEAALAILEDHRVIYFIRAAGRPIRDHKSTHESLAIEGAYNAGWHDAIDALVNFKEVWIDTYNKTKPSNLKVDYGGRRTLLEKGDITQKEFDRLGNPNAKSPVSNS